MLRWTIFSLIVACLPVSAQVVLRIDDSAPVTIAAADLGQLPRHTAALSEHGKLTSYEGVLLQDLLAKNGLDLGKGVHGKQLSSYVAALAGDGYEVVYALAEFDTTVMDSGIIVADKREGQPLTGNEGPLRMVVPHDKRPTRCLRMLKEIDVIQLNK